MATEKTTAKVLDDRNDEIKESTSESNSKRSNAPHFGKALAYRALYGPSNRRAASRQVRNDEVKTLPSRLSRVSPAGEREQ